MCLTLGEDHSRNFDEFAAFFMPEVYPPIWLCYRVFAYPFLNSSFSCGKQPILIRLTGLSTVFKITSSVPSVDTLTTVFRGETSYSRNVRTGTDLGVP